MSILLFSPFPLCDNYQKSFYFLIKTTVIMFPLLSKYEEDINSSALEEVVCTKC